MPCINVLLDFYVSSLPLLYCGITSINIPRGSVFIDAMKTPHPTTNLPPLQLKKQFRSLFHAVDAICIYSSLHGCK